MTSECTRILVADDLHRLTRGLIKRILSEEAGMRVVRPRAKSLPAAVSASAADVVIVGKDDPRLAATLLEAQPRLRMLAVVGDGRSALLYELRPNREELGELSPESLLQALRAARKPRSDWLP